MSNQAGRKACPQCEYRDTEITRSSDVRNKRDFECHTCHNEWTEFTGPDCPACNSNNTRKVTTGVVPHRSTEIQCYDCG